MTDQPVGPRCGNNPNARLTPGDRKAVEDFKGRLALQKSAKPYVDRAVWVDGDPLMEVIAAVVWERCARDDEDMPQAVCDDPRTIAAFAAAVARAHAAVVLPPADRAALRDRIAAALIARIKQATVSKAQPWDAVTSLLAATEYDLADAVLPVLPAPADRAAVYREIADLLAADAEQGAKDGLTRIYRRSAATQVREWADALAAKAQPTRGQCTRCSHGEGAHNVSGCIECPGGWRADHRFAPADEARPTQPDEAPPVCQGFVWIGQPFTSCDRCGQPAWDHQGEEVPVEGAGPFDTRRTVRPWKPGQADAIRAKWAPSSTAEARQDGARP